MVGGSAEVKSEGGREAWSFVEGRLGFAETTLGRPDYGAQREQATMAPSVRLVGGEEKEEKNASSA